MFSFTTRGARALLLLASLAAPAAAQLPPVLRIDPEPERRVGFIDLQGAAVGEEAIRHQMSPFIAARTFLGGLAAVQRVDSSWTWIERAGGRAINAVRYQSVSNFLGGHAFARRMDDTVVSVTPDGKERALQAPGIRFLRTSEFAFYTVPDSAGRDRFGYLAPDGRRVTPPMFQSIGPFQFGRGFGRRVAGGPLVIVDARGRVVADTGMYADESVVIAYNRAAVRAAPKGLIGYVDSTGRWAIPPRFEKAEDFADARAAVTLPGVAGWSVIDTLGKVMMEGLAEAPDFHAGYARVKRLGEDTTFIARADGTPLPGATRHMRNPGTDGIMAVVGDGQPMRYVTPEGKVVLTAAQLSHPTIATRGLRFVEGVSQLVLYDSTGYERRVAERRTARATAASAANANKDGLTRYVWYELRRHMGPRMGARTSAASFTVYWGVVWASPGVTAQAMSQAFPSRPQQSLAPTRRVDAVEWPQGEELDLDEILVRRNRADFDVSRRGGKDRIDNPVRYTKLDDIVLRR